MRRPPAQMWLPATGPQMAPRFLMFSTFFLAHEARHKSPLQAERRAGPQRRKQRAERGKRPKNTPRGFKGGMEPRQPWPAMEACH